MFIIGIIKLDIRIFPINLIIRLFALVDPKRWTETEPERLGRTVFALDHVIQVQCDQKVDEAVD
jgi:hypothetical protein